MAEPVLDVLSSDEVRELVNNGSSVKLFNKIHKRTESDEPVEFIAKKVDRGHPLMTSHTKYLQER